MLKKSLIVLLLIPVVGFGAYKIFFQAKPYVSVLVFSKTEGFRHESIGAGKVALMDLGKKHKFRVDTTEDAAVFKEKTLKDYNLVVFLNTTGDVLNNAQQLEFNRFIQAGGGFVGIHAATDTEYDWPWYGDLVGAYFESHPNDPNVREGIIQVKDQEHIACQHLPAEWKREDEWYNFKDIRSHINILLNLDEASYEGGTNGENHPAAWYHEFDGGRSFYTALGHTPETFSDPLFIEHLWGGMQYALGQKKPVDYNQSTVAPEENRFQKVVLGDHLEEPMELEMLPDRSLMFVERNGAVKVFKPNADSAEIVLRLNVFHELEDGLLGLAIDPAFAENRWVYFYYSPSGDEPKQVLARITYGEDGFFDMNSQKILLEVLVQREECCHSAGSLEFGPQGNLYLSIGDNTNPHASDGYAPIDEQAGRGPWDAQKSSSNPNDFRGKILRIKPEADGTYSIPDGNLFAKDGSEGKPEIYVMGCRNPYRISVDQKTGYLYWGEVGPDAGEDSLGRGPMGYDEVNQAKQAGFYGWPYFVGNNQAYHDFNFASQTSGEAFNPEKPINDSPNNTGAKELPPAQEAFIWYPYGESEEFPLVGDGARNAMAGPVFYHKDFPDNPNRYPEYYDGKLFTYDWMRGWIMNVSMDENGDFVRMDQFLPSVEFNNIIDIILGPDGDIYLLEYGTVWFTGNPDARLVHLKYVAGNRPPVASIEVGKTVGAAPLTLNFSGEKTIDYDGDELTYEWYFDGNEVSSTEISTAHTFNAAGKYKVKLKVTDVNGEVGEDQTEIWVGNELPEISWQFSGNRSFYWEGQSLDYEVSVQDKEDGTIGNGIDHRRVNVSIDYLERGFDMNEIAMGHQALSEASQFLLGKQLMDQSDCKTCHQPKQQSVGPSYEAIGIKYKDDAQAVPNLSEKIIKGGGGVWGETVMAAHPQLSESEAAQMVKYILSLSGAAPIEEGLPLKGTYTFKPTGVSGGVYILSASYTDKGGEKIGPLTARSVFKLRPAYVPAAEYDGIEKAMKFEVKKGQFPGIEEDLELVVGTANSYVSYKDLDLTGIQAIAFTGNANSTFMGGGTIEFRVDTPDGKLIASLPIKAKLTTKMYERFLTNLEPTEGVHDLFVHFIPAEGGKDKPITAMIGLEFLVEPEG